MAKKNGKNGNNHNSKKIKEPIANTLTRTSFLFFIGVLVYIIIGIHIKNFYGSDFCLLGFGIIISFSILCTLFLKNLCKIPRYWIVPFILFMTFFFILGLWHVGYSFYHKDVNMHVIFWMTVAFIFLIVTIIKQCIYQIKEK